MWLEVLFSSHLFNIAHQWLLSHCLVLDKQQQVSQELVCERDIHLHSLFGLLLQILALSFCLDCPLSRHCSRLNCYDQDRVRRYIFQIRQSKLCVVKHELRKGI